MLARAILLVQTPVRLQRAKSSVNACLRNRHLPAMKKITIKLTSRCLVQPASQCWRKLVDSSFLPTIVRSWLRQQIRFIHGCPRTFYSQCRASSLAKKVDWGSCWRDIPADTIADRILMKSAVKIDKRWHIEIRKDLPTMMEEIHGAIQQSYDDFLWWHGVPWQAHAASTQPLWWDTSIQRVQAFYDSTAAPYAERTAGMLPPPGRTIVVDDKDKNT